MSAIVGARDKALRATIPRNINPTAGKVLLLEVDPSAVHFDADGNPTTPVITFTARPLGFDATVMWSITNGGTLAGTGKNVRTMAASSMTAASVKVTVTAIFEGQAYINVKTVGKIKDGKVGTSADPADLSPEALVAALEGRIVKSSLNADLRSLIDGPDSDPTTIPGKIKKETDLRVGAINQEISDRIAALVAEAGARTTYVQTYAFSKQEVNSALSIQASAITAAYTAYSDTAKTQTLAAAYAYTGNYAYSRGDIDAAEAAQTSALTANYRNYADSASQQAVSTANAYVQTYAYGRADSDSALSALASTLRSEFSSNNGVSVAYLNNYAFSKAETNSAISSATQTLSTTVGQHTAAIQQQFTSIDGLSAQLTWKIDNNGHVSGFGLASTPVNGVPYSIVIFNVDALAVSLPGGVGKTIFTVGQVDGQSQAVFRTDLFVDGGLTARMLNITTSGGALNRDPNFVDRLGSWEMGGNYSFLMAGGAAPAPTYFAAPNLDAYALAKELIPIDSNKTYVLDVSVYNDPFNVGLCLLVVNFYDASGNKLSTGWGDASWSGIIRSFSPTTGDWYPYRENTFGVLAAGKSIPSGAKSCRIGVYLNAAGSATNNKLMGATALRLEELVDSTRIGPGVVETKHLTIANGGHFASGQTGFDEGEGWWLEGANTDHGPRLSLGDSLGRKILCDPRRGIMQLINMDDLKPKFSASITNTQGQAYFTGPKANTFMGLFDVATLNGSAPFTYTWTIAGSSDIAQCRISGAINGTRVSLYGSSQVTGEFDFYLSVQATDGSGRVATQTYLVTGNFT